MNSTQFFTDSMALELREALAGSGIELPVVGQVSEPDADGLRLEVRCEGAEDLIPGNYTVRLDCQLVLHFADVGMTADEVEGMLAAVGMVCRQVLREPWEYRVLRDPRPGRDEEYEAAPYLVLGIVPELQPVEVSGAAYVGVLGFRAFVQF